jgi:hypothetical protein
MEWAFRCANAIVFGGGGDLYAVCTYTHVSAGLRVCFFVMLLVCLTAVPPSAAVPAHLGPFLTDSSASVTLSDAHLAVECTTCVSCAACMWRVFALASNPTLAVFSYYFTSQHGGGCSG